MTPLDSVDSIGVYVERGKVGLFGYRYIGAIFTASEVTNRISGTESNDLTEDRKAAGWMFSGDSITSIRLDWLYSTCIAFLELLKHVSVRAIKHELRADARRLRSVISFHHPRPFTRPSEGWFA